MTPVTLGLGCAAGERAADLVGVALVDVGEGLGAALDPTGADEVAPSSAPEHPAAAPSTTPAEPRISARLDTTLELWRALVVASQDGGSAKGEAESATYTFLLRHRWNLPTSSTTAPYGLSLATLA